MSTASLEMDGPSQRLFQNLDADCLARINKLRIGYGCFSDVWDVEVNGIRERGLVRHRRLRPRAESDLSEEQKSEFTADMRKIAGVIADSRAGTRCAVKTWASLRVKSSWTHLSTSGTGAIEKWSFSKPIP